MFATPDGPPVEARLAEAARQLVVILGDADAGARLLFRLSLFGVVWLAPLLILRPPTFSRLAHADRLRALHRFERSPFGLSLFALKAMLCIVWFEQPATLAHAGVTDACLVESGS